MSFSFLFVETFLNRRTVSRLRLSLKSRNSAHRSKTRSPKCVRGSKKAAVDVFHDCHAAAARQHGPVDFGCGGSTTGGAAAISDPPPQIPALYVRRIKGPVEMNCKGS